MITGYWLLQIINGQPNLWGPFESDAARLGEYDMCLIDPGTEYLIFIDPDNVAEPGKPWAWKPSQDFRRERLDYINNIPDEAIPNPSFICPGCGRKTHLVMNGATCPMCMGGDT